jgi:ribosomal RNA-processing protein 1
MASDIQQTPFVKQLAANGKAHLLILHEIRQIKLTPASDRPTRDAALLSLRTYLSNRHHTLTPLDLLKIWKGLFYSLWMCDRPKPQASLCADLASLLPLLPASTQIPFLRAFWQTMAREWTNIDVLRMEKFLLLVRRYVGAMFTLMEEAGWEEGVVGSLLGVLEEVPLEVEDMRLPNGLRYHVIDVYVDELERVGAIKEEGGEVPLEGLLQPLRKLGRDSPTKDVRRKCREALKDERLPGNKEVVKEKEMADGEWGGIED